MIPLPRLRPIDITRDFFRGSGGHQRYVFCPFIQGNALRTLLGDLPRARGVVVTRWNPDDLMTGASDLMVFDVCRDLDLTLLVNPRLHMKVYSWDLNTAVVGSANLTESGMGIGANPNLEFVRGMISLSAEDQRYLREVLHSSSLVTPEVYESAREWLNSHHGPLPPPPSSESPWVELAPESSMLVSALPMMRSSLELKRAFLALREGRWGDIPSNERQCALHDLVNYQLFDASPKDFDSMLRERFFAHPFTQKITEKIAPCAYFGELKEWIQRSCQDVPVPSRRDLTGNVQVLLSWFVDLGDGEFIVDVPGAHSQRICRKGTRHRGPDATSARAGRLRQVS